MNSEIRFLVLGGLLLPLLSGCLGGGLQPEATPTSNAAASGSVTAGPTLTSLSPTTGYVNGVPATVTAVFNTALATVTTNKFAIGGTCTTPPTVSLVTMSEANTTAAATLSGGTCTDTQTLTVSINPTLITNTAGTAGTGTSNTKTYTFDTVGPIATLATPSSTVIKNGDSPTVAFTLADAGSGGISLTGTLTTGGGGVTLTTATGNAACSGVAVSSITTSGATITPSGCTGNGTLTVRVDAGIATDALGNSSGVSSASSTITVDNTAPTAGTVINYTSVTSSTLTVNWGAATDTITGASSLQYKLVRASSSAAIDTVPEVDAITTSGGGLVMDWTANQLQANDSSLSSGTTYYYAVIVRDVAQNKAIYAPVGQATLTPPTVGTGLTWTQKCGGSIAATWGVATDADTAQANLTYKVVYSTSNNISTVANAEANGIVAMNWTANTTNKLISGLTAGNTYYVNVLVRNNNSVMAAYGSASTTAATKALYLIQTTNNGQGYTWRIALDGSKVDYQNLTGRSINLDSSCNLYAGDTGGVVRKYDAFGNNLWTNNTGLGGGTVSSLALDEVNGILYAFGGLGIYTLNMSNGTVNSSFTYPTGNLGGNTSHGGNYFPDTDVLIQGDGNTGGSSTSRVWKMTGTGASNTAVTAPNDSFYGISGAQRDATGGYLLSDYSGSRALRFTLSGSTLTPDTSFGTSGKIDFTTQASSLAIDDSGNIYVSLRGLGVKKYSSAGALLDTSFYLYDGGTGPSSWQIVYK